jgi:hypothetical protein
MASGTLGIGPELMFHQHLGKFGRKRPQAVQLISCIFQVVELPASKSLVSTGGSWADFACQRPNFKFKRLCLLHSPVHSRF